MDVMNQKFLSGFTATLLMVLLGILPSYADQSGASSEATDAGAAAKVSIPEPFSNQEASTRSSDLEASSPDTDRSQSDAQPADAQPADAQRANLQPPNSQPQEAVKVGEYQSQQQASPDETITLIHSHELAGRQAVTLYVRNLPVLTFLGAAIAADNAYPPASPAVASSATPKTSAASASSLPIDTAPPDTKVASIQNRTLPNTQVGSQSNPQPNSQANAADAQSEAGATDPHDPLWRATAIAARLNQLHRDNVDASTITVAWDEQQHCYMIKAGKESLVQMTADTILPNTTENPAEDALQATNLIRRQVGNAPPLQSVTGGPEARAPQSGTQVALGPVRLSVSGMASWYGPGFDGASSASGEVFNQNALTAAHRDLPFGTQVRVTNMDNGMSVVVRINDRGPYSGDRIIDLSRGAAAVIGLVQSGVAPVKLEVLDSTAAR
jgi:rare lipoprotein A